MYLSNLKEQIPGLPDKKEIDDKVEAGIDRLAIMQNNDGALPMWMGDHDWPWVSVYAAHFLAVAQQARYRVPTELHDHLLDYVLSRLAVSGDDPQLVELQAYACYVLALSRQPDISSMSRLTDLLARPVDGGPMQSAQTAFHLAAAWQLVGEHDRANRLLPRAVPMLRKDRLLDDNIDSQVREAAVMLSDAPDLSAGSSADSRAGEIPGRERPGRAMAVHAGHGICRDGAGAIREGDEGYQAV